MSWSSVQPFLLLVGPNLAEVNMDYANQYLYEQGRNLNSTGSLQCYFNVRPGRGCEIIGPEIRMWARHWWRTATH